MRSVRVISFKEKVIMASSLLAAAAGFALSVYGLTISVIIPEFSSMLLSTVLWLMLLGASIMLARVEMTAGGRARTDRFRRFVVISLLILIFFMEICAFCTGKNVFIWGGLVNGWEPLKCSFRIYILRIILELLIPLFILLTSFGLIRGQSRSKGLFTVLSNLFWIWIGIIFVEGPEPTIKTYLHSLKGVRSHKEWVITDARTQGKEN